MRLSIWKFWKQSFSNGLSKRFARIKCKLNSDKIGINFPYICFWLHSRGHLTLFPQDATSLSFNHYLKWTLLNRTYVSNGAYFVNHLCFTALFSWSFSTKTGHWFVGAIIMQSVFMNPLLHFVNNKIVHLTLCEKKTYWKAQIPSFHYLNDKSRSACSCLLASRLERIQRKGHSVTATRFSI